MLLGNLFPSQRLLEFLMPICLGERKYFLYEYDSQWLKNQQFFLDPDLMLYKGRQYTQHDKTLFGIFTDSCPERWGRLLMTRREAIFAREENRTPKKLLESDFLLGIQDSARMGALRFKTDLDAAFLAEDSKDSIPVRTCIRELEQAAYIFEKEDSSLEDEKKWLKILLQPGSSLGGARPKATVQDFDGNFMDSKVSLKA